MEDSHENNHSSDPPLLPEDIYDILSNDLLPEPINSNYEAEGDTTTEEMAKILNTDEKLLMKVNSLHSPFTWKPEDHLKLYQQDELDCIVGVDEMNEEGFKLRRFVIHMIQCYHYFYKRLIEDSIKHLNEMEKMLLTSMKTKSRDVYFTSISDALFHIMQSCRVSLLHYTAQKEKALQILRKITPYEELNNCNKAGIWAVRANLYVEFGYEGVKAAVEYINKSVTIDPKNPYWNFTKGVYLGRLRRLESSIAIPSVEEISAFEISMKMKEDASFMAFAAEVYVETANRSMKQYQQLFLNCKENEKNELLLQNDLLNEHAAMLFKKSISLNSNCAHLLFRCGKGMLKLPPPHQDLKLAREYLQKGLSLSYESSFGNHAMAMYYLKHEQNIQLAKKYLIKAIEQKNFGAAIDLIRINFLENQDPESLLGSLHKLFDTFSDRVKHKKILAEIVSYYLFIDYNLPEAINYMKKLLHVVGDNDRIITVFKSGILRQKFPVSLLEILLSDITDRSNRKTLTSDEQELCKTFLNHLCFLNIDLPIPKDENLRKTMLSEIKANFKTVNVGIKKCPVPGNPKDSSQPARKDYNPAENSSDREYARRYYAKNDENPTKTAVEKFFQQYEAEVMAKSKQYDEAGTTKYVSGDVKDVTNKPGDSQENSNNVTSVSSRSPDNNLLYRLAKQFELHVSLSSQSSSEYKSKDIGNETSAFHNDNCDDFIATQISRIEGSIGFESHTSRSYRNRPISPESHTSSHRKQPPNDVLVSETESRSSRTNSNDCVGDEAKLSHKRSLSGSSRTSSRKKSPSERQLSDLKSDRKRSTSRESRMSRRKRSSSRENRRRSLSRSSRTSSRKKSPSERQLSDLKSDRKRSTSRESRMSRRKRSSSRENRRRSLSKSSRVSSRKKSPHDEKRSPSRESRKRRSVSRESHRSCKSDRRRDYRDDDKQHKAKKSHKSSRRSRSPSHRYKKNHRKYSSSSDRSRSSSRSLDRHRRHGKSRRCDSGDTLIQSSCSDSDYSKKSRKHRDRYEHRSDRRRSYSRDRHRSRRNRKYDYDRNRRTSDSESDDSYETHRSKRSHKNNHGGKHWRYRSDEFSSSSASGTEHSVSDSSSSKKDNGCENQTKDKCEVLTDNAK